MIKVCQPLFFSEQGKRSNNEDFVGFEGTSHFVVCDGVGGNEKGEVASSLVGTCFLKEFSTNPDLDAANALQLAEAGLSAHILQNPETDGMATTLTFSQIQSNGIYVVWCGDSRIYQFRAGEIIFQTFDHSWVNEAVKAGIITKEEGVNHPKSNIITRAIRSEANPTQVDSFLIRHIEKSDFLLHCTDGLLEAWSNTDLEALFRQGNSPCQIMARLQEECKNLSRDNATALLYQVESVEDLPETVHTSLKTDEIEIPPLNRKRKIKPVVKSISIVLVFLIFLVIGFLVLREKNEEPNFETKKDKTKSKRENVVNSRKAAEFSRDDSSTNQGLKAATRDTMINMKLTPFKKDSIKTKKPKRVNP